MILQVMIAAVLLAINGMAVFSVFQQLTSTVRRRQVLETYQGIGYAALSRIVVKVAQSGDLAAFVRRNPVFAGSGCATATGWIGLNPCVKTQLSPSEVVTLLGASQQGQAYSSLSEASSVTLNYEVRFYDGGGNLLTAAAPFDALSFAVFEVHVHTTAALGLVTGQRIASVNTVMAF